MYSRNTTFHVKPNMDKEIAVKFEKDVLPILRNAKGFRDQITLVGNSTTNPSIGITLWDSKEQLEAYSRDTDPQVVRLLETFINGKPEVRVYPVSSSTSHKFVAA